MFHLCEQGLRPRRYAFRPRSYGVVLNDELEKFDDYNAENLEWIRDMEGEIFSTVPANCEKNELAPLTVEELGQKLREMDIIIPYGTY